MTYVGKLDANKVYGADGSGRIGAVTGGGGGSLTEYWIPDPLFWEDTGVTSPVTMGCAFRISNTLYIFGGAIGGDPNNLTDKIYSASYDASGNTPVFSETGATLPSATSGLRVVLLDNTLYAYGSKGGLTSILSASVGSPTSWSATGASLSVQRSAAPIVVANGYVMIMGGYTGASGLQTIQYASTATPTTVATTGNIFSNTVWESGAAVFGGSFVNIGGVNFGTTVYQCSELSIVPSTIPNSLNGAIPATSTTEGDPEIFDLGTEAVAVGIGFNPGFGPQPTNRVLRCPRGSELQSNGWYVTNPLPATTNNIFGSRWIGGDGRMYFINRQDQKIYRSGRRKCYVPAVTNVTGEDYSGLMGWLEDGTPACVSMHVRMGIAPWFTNRRTTF